MGALHQTNFTHLSAAMYRWASKMSPLALSAPVDFFMTELEPLFATKRMAAELVSTRHETHDTTTFVLRPSIHWQGFVPGQYVAIEVDIAGVRYRRNYSISSSVRMFEEQSLVSITVKRVEGGIVSNYLADHLELDGLLHISEAQGSFIMDPIINSEETAIENAVAPVFVAAGSGITPIMAMIESMAQSSTLNKATLIYAARSKDDVIFEQRLMELKAAHPDFVMITHFATEASGHLNQQCLVDYCPDLANRAVYTCGPEGFMSTVRAASKALGVDIAAIKSESFGVPRKQDTLANLAQLRSMSGRNEVNVTLSKTQQTLNASGEKTLLEIAEEAGLKPKFGCRMGVCHECKCTKSSGQVVNALTGELVSEEQTQIQACISIPVGDVAIENW